MANETKNRPRRWLPFPAVSGVLAGLIPGVSALFMDVSQPFWVSVKVAIIAVAFSIAAANLIGLAVVWYRRSSGRANP